jgi:hypothetical protein
MPLPRLPAPNGERVYRGDARAGRRVPRHPGRAEALRERVGRRQRGDKAFCGDCGSPIFIQVSTRPDLVGLRVGTLDDPSGFRPEADIFVKSAQPWDYMNPALPKYATYPPGKSYG